MNLGNRIKQERQKNGLTLDTVAKAVGTSRQTIFKYENNIITNIPIDKIEKMAKLFNCSSAYLMGWDEFPTPYNVVSKKGVKIPVLGVIPAGIPIEAIEDIVDWEEVPIDWTKGGKEYFALQVKGDSMYPEYLPDDVVILQKTPVCESGDDCVVYVNGYNATLKRIIKNEDGSLTIKPINTNYAPQTFSAEEIEKLPVTIGGIVVELRRKRKNKL